MKNTNYALENNIREANDRINLIESKIVEGSHRYAEMRDSLNSDINAVSAKHSKLKTSFDDICIELRHRVDQLRELQGKTEVMTAKFRHTQDSLTAEQSRTTDENLHKTNHLADLRRDYAN